MSVFQSLRPIGSFPISSPANDADGAAAASAAVKSNAIVFLPKNITIQNHVERIATEALLQIVGGFPFEQPFTVDLGLLQGLSVVVIQNSSDDHFSFLPKETIDSFPDNVKTSTGSFLFLQDTLVVSALNRAAIMNRVIKVYNRNSLYKERFVTMDLGLLLKGIPVFVKKKKLSDFEENVLSCIREDVPPPSYDRAVVIAAVQRRGVCIRSVDKCYQYDKQIALLAVTQDKEAMLFISERLQKDPDVRKAAGLED